MSNLEDKLSASIQTQRRRPGAGKPGEADKGDVKPATPNAQEPAGTKEGDLNEGGGRSPNPPRIWPD